MEKDRNEKGEHGEKISELNNIFEELLSDGRELARDLMAGITTTFVAGVLSIIFGIQTAYYNRNYILQGDFVPLLIAAAIIVVGIIIILQGLILKKKYSRISKAYKELDKH